MKIIKKFNKIRNLNKYQKNIKLNSAFSKRFYQSNKINELIQKIDNMGNKLEYLTKIIYVNKYENYDVKNIIPTNESIKIQPSVELFDKNKFNEYVKNKQFNKLLNFNEIDYEQIDMKSFIVGCKNNYIVKHVVDNLINHHDRTIVELLCKYGNYDIIKHYIRENDSEKLDKMLFWACENEDSSVISYLINHYYTKPHLNKLNDKKCGLLGHAYNHNNIEAFKILLEDGADVNISQNINNMNDVKLIHSICNSHYQYENKLIDYLKLMIKYGADINAVDLNKYTALHYAIEQHNIKIIDLLVKSGANVNNYLPIHMILKQNRLPESMIERISALGPTLDLTQKIYNTTVLKYALDTGLSLKNGEYVGDILVKKNKINVDVKVVNHLLKHYVQYNTNYNELKQYYGISGSEPDDMCGMKLVHYACIMEDIDFLKELIKNKVNVCIQDNFGNSPDHYVCISNNYDMYKLLYKKTDIVQSANKYGKYPSDYARNKINNYRIKMNIVNWMFLICVGPLIVVIVTAFTMFCLTIIVICYL